MQPSWFIGGSCCSIRFSYKWKIMEAISTYYIVSLHLRKYTCETHDQEQPCQSKCFAITCMHFPPKKQPFVLLQVNTAHRHMSLHTYNCEFVESYIINNSNYLWSTWRCIKIFLCIYDHSNNILFNNFWQLNQKYTVRIPCHYYEVI